MKNTKDFNVLIDGESNKPEGMRALGEFKLLGTEIKLNQNFYVWGNVGISRGWK